VANLDIEEGLLEAQLASKEDPPKETKEENATKTGSTTGSGMTNEVLSISIGSRYDQ
jgi:hypothetical protein